MTISSAANPNISMPNVSGSVVPSKARPTMLPKALDSAVVKKAWKEEAAPAPLANGSIEIAPKLEAVKATAIIVAD